MIPQFVIKSLSERDEETGEPLFWNNQFGWVSLDAADRFTYGETRRLGRPVGSAWVILDEALEGGRP